jgi:integrase/recombinase XerD
MDNNVDLCKRNAERHGVKSDCMALCVTLTLHLLQSGVDIAVIALWLGHESIQTTHGYIEADLAIKEQALQKLAPAGKTIIRFKADDALLTFLASL